MQNEILDKIKLKIFLIGIDGEESVHIKPQSKEINWGPIGNLILHKHK